VHINASIKKAVACDYYHNHNCYPVLQPLQCVCLF